ncbi:MAG: acetylornithine/succinylornithine family transaminase [Defluviitaleaceae bacterium]|nr:acetylornithine/succinylornithine family transaminase [Defluviitaleaceae bacterium]
MNEYILQTYKKYGVTFVKGVGSKLWDNNGKEYIDFASGIGVVSIGHSHPSWVEALNIQGSQLSHTSNLFYTLPGQKLAEKLCNITNMEAAFFANSGAEANEGLIKLARKYSSDKYGKGRHTIVTLIDSFHGRTMGSLSATGQEKFHKHFDPFTPGFIHIKANDLQELNSLKDRTDICAFLIEPIQGEGGVNPLDYDYVREIANFCNKNDILLFVDEVQTGSGRCGKWFCYEYFDILPDAISFAKGVGGGIPIGGFLVNNKLKNILSYGDHGTTFGGNPLCCSVALATLGEIENILPNVNEKGEYIKSKIEKMNLKNVINIRGKGLMIGVKVDLPTTELNEKFLENGLVLLTAGKDVIRFLPALNIGYEEINIGLEIFEKVMRKV